MVRFGQTLQAQNFATKPQHFDSVHVLDPFGVTGQSSAAFNPREELNPTGLDVAEDAGTLADALVFDEPGMSGSHHCRS